MLSRWETRKSALEIGKQNVCISNLLKNADRCWTFNERWFFSKYR